MVPGKVKLSKGNYLSEFIFILPGFSQPGSDKLATFIDDNRCKAHWLKILCG